MPESNSIKYQNSEQDRRILFLEDKFATINSEMSDVKTDVGKIKTDVCWLKWWMKLVATATVSSLIVGIIQLLGK